MTVKMGVGLILRYSRNAPHRDSHRDDGSSVQADIGSRVYDIKAKPGVSLGILIRPALSHPVFISHTGPSISFFEMQV